VGVLAEEHLSGGSPVAQPGRQVGDRAEGAVVVASLEADPAQRREALGDPDAQRQVVALARSAIRVNGESQGILLLDEPTAALGYEQTKNVEALIRRMADAGIAIVIVTHDLPLCYEVADRIVILNRGKKVADVPASGTDRDHVVGWITGSRASMYADPVRSTAV
jgi:ABC-type sugar transport system ATPase subunit